MQSDNKPIQRDRCNTCNKHVLDNQKNVSYQYNQCNNQTHNKCNDITNINESKAQCLKCSITFNYRNIPFTLCNNVELSNTNEYNSSKFLNSLPSFEIISEASKFSQSNDVDLNLAFQNDCSYYSVNELCGDFNIDLLKIENNQNYHQFYNMLCSFGFLPKIIQPTRVTDHHSTLIDKIFSNNLTDETKWEYLFNII